MTDAAGAGEVFFERVHGVAQNERISIHYAGHGGFNLVADGINLGR
jgi:hypothetical protein